MAESTPLPVLLIFFNRADCVEQTLGAIRAARPPRIYLATDAPRPDVPTDVARCAAAQAMVDRLIDWPCTVQRRKTSTNRGSGETVAAAIFWFFTHEERGLIFEDDCLPDPAFFPFCAELLDRYADDPRVAMISGDQFVPGGWACQDGASYAFVRLSQIWGWATWRRAWANFDPTMAAWPGDRERRMLHRIFRSRHDRKYWDRRFTWCHRNEMNVWDYRWAYARWHHDQVGIVPARNLVSNIGFRPDALHTTMAHPVAAMPTQPLQLPLRHPPTVAIDYQLDARTARILFYEGDWLTYQRDKLLRRVRALFRQ